MAARLKRHVAIECVSETFTELNDQKPLPKSAKEVIDNNNHKPSDAFDIGYGTALRMFRDSVTRKLKERL